MVRRFLSSLRIRYALPLSKIWTAMNQNNLNIPNSDNSISTPKFPHSNIQNCSSFDTLITPQILIYTESLRPNLLRWFPCGQ